MKYKCYGHFYPLRELSFRDVLLISDVENISDNFVVDLLVVMMNPGSSEPLNTNDKITVFSKECVLTKPDNTQSQVMEVMTENGYGTAVVINLSDVREPKSSHFSRKLKGLSFGSVGEKHSLFSEQRYEELSGIIDKCGSCPVIFASGVNYKLRFLTREAISKFEDNRIIGIKNMKDLFYHPLPRSKQKQEEWVDEINRQIRHSAS